MEFSNDATPYAPPAPIPTGRAPVVAAAGETAVAASAAQVKAEIESAYAMARAFPRDWDRVRERINADCKRQLFAEAAIYRLPRRSFNRETKKYETVQITGRSIRFAEGAMRALGNLRVVSKVLFEDDEQRMLQVVVTELESNITIPGEAVIKKTAERRKVNDGQTVIGKRVTSDGGTVFIVPVAENDLRAKMNAEASILIRNAIERLLPADIAEEAELIINQTLANAMSKDPAAVSKLVEGFARHGVKEADIAAYLKKPVKSMTADEWARLKQVGLAIKDHQTTWAEFVAGEDEDADPAPATDENPAERAELIRDAASIKANRPDAHEMACRAQSLDVNAVVDALPLAQLRQFVTIARAKSAEPRGD